jgi:hypothetical protein
MSAWTICSLKSASDGCSRRLRGHGPTPYAFPLREHFPPPGSDDAGPLRSPEEEDLLCLSNNGPFGKIMKLDHGLAVAAGAPPQRERRGGDRDAEPGADGGGGKPPVR